MTPGELLDTELRIAYVEMHERLDHMTKACTFWRELAQHWAQRLDANDIRKDPLYDLFPPHTRGSGESAVTSYPPYPAGSPVPDLWSAT